MNQRHATTAQPLEGAPRCSRAGLGLATAALLLAGCATPRATRPAPDAAAVRAPAALEEVRAALEARRVGVQSLRGRGTLVVASPEWEGATRVQAILLARRPEELRIRGYTPISTAFDVLTDPTHFVLHLPEAAEAWTGPPEELGPATGLPLVPADLVAALFALPFEVHDSLRIVRLEHDYLEATWQLADGAIVEAHFRRHPTLPDRFRLRQGGRVRVELEYGDYLLEAAGWWPRQYALTWPDEQAHFRLQLVSVELNPTFEPGSFVIEPPAGTQWVRVSAGGTAPATGGR